MLEIIDLRKRRNSGFETCADQVGLVLNDIDYHGGSAYEAWCSYNHNPLNYIGQAISDGYVVTQEGKRFTIHNEFIGDTDEQLEENGFC